MPFYAIRNRKTGELFSILGAITGGDSGNEALASRLTIELEPALTVGCYGRQPIFVTERLDLVRFLMLTKVGDEHGSYIILAPPYDATLADLECVDLATMAVVDIGADLPETVELLRAPPYRDVRVPD